MVAVAVDVFSHTHTQEFMSAIRFALFFPLSPSIRETADLCSVKGNKVFRPAATRVNFELRFETYDLLLTVILGGTWDTWDTRTKITVLARFLRTCKGR